MTQPAPTRPPTEAELLLRVARKALRDGEVTLTMPTAKDAARLRFAFYNALKPIRDERLADPELTGMTGELVVTVDACLVRVRRRLTPALYSAIAGALGESLDEASATPMTAADAQIKASEEELLRKLGQPDNAATVQTPYYTREG